MSAPSPEARKRQSAFTAMQRIARGEITAERLVRDHIDRIEAREPEVLAWAHFDPEAALAEARARDKAGRTGALHGIPIGLKDIIDTHDMPTRHGSVIYEDNRPTRDADCVMRARAAGAVVMGKTNTTEFAWAFPTVTRNPHDPARTPGGSSSGSAAAVGDGMVPLAFGTQTGGSTLRPSAFCGVVGFKPTHGRHNVAGVKPLSPLSDTLGLHGVTVEDVALLDHALLQLPGDIAAFTGRKPLRVGLCRTASWDVAEPYVKERLMEAADLLRAESIEIAEAEVPPEWAELLDICFPLMEGDGARTLAWEYENHRDLISPVALAQLERGRAMSDKALAALKERKAAYAAALDAFVGGYDVLLTPSAPGEAPVGLNSTGSSAFNRVWTAAQVPCITLPSGRELSGMPIAVQLVARRSQDQALLAHAKFVADALARAGLN